jgi:hypothetical protein
MVLDAEHRLASVLKALTRSVVQVDVADINVRWKPLGIDGIPMVLCCDRDTTGGGLLHRMVGSTVTEL